jgi:hypothetical protein
MGIIWEFLPHCLQTHIVQRVPKKAYNWHPEFWDSKIQTPDFPFHQYTVSHAYFALHERLQGGTQTKL